MECETVIVTYVSGNVQLNEADSRMRLELKLHLPGHVNGFPAERKPGTGDPLHTQEPVTVASFRTWRGWRECVARDRCLTFDSSIPQTRYSSLSHRNRQQ